MRAIWTGELSFGMVTIPAKLYAATKDLTPTFHQLHKECGTRINMVRRCNTCSRDVTYEEIGKGYEVAKNTYALFTTDELAKIDGEDASSGIDIVEFIQPSEVNMACIEKSYWVAPGGKTSLGFKLLHHVLTETGLAGLAKVKIRSRTRLGILQAKGHVFSLNMLRFADEMVQSTDLVLPESKPISPKEITLAKALVAQLTSPFDPAKHPDTYRMAVLAAAETKATLDAPALPANTGGTKLLDLAALLEQSLQPVAR